MALDTNCALYYLGTHTVWRQLASRVFVLAIHGRILARIPAVVALELLVRPLRTGDMEEESRVHRVIGGLPNVRMIDDAYETFIAAAVVRAHTGLSVADSLVVGSAAIAGCTAIIGNDATFRRIDGLSPQEFSAAGIRVDVVPAYVHMDDYVTAGG